MDKKIAILTIAYKRHFIFEIWAKEMSRFGYPVFVVNDEPEIEKICNDYDFEFLNHANTSLTEKWNYGLKHLREFDYVITFNSDSIISDNFFKPYHDAIKRKVDYFGLTDLYCHDFMSNKTYYWGGYTNYRKNETIGSGRMFSKKLLEKVNYRLLEQPVMRNYDGKVDTQTISKIKKKIRIDYTSCKDENIHILELNTFRSITNIKNFRHEIEVENIREFKKNSDAELLIIMPVYNDGSYIDKTLESLFEQSYQNFRITIINDSSTDNTLDVLEKWFLKYPERIKIFTNQDNVGTYRSMNRALYIESNSFDWKYFFVSGGDDIHWKDRFAKCINAFSPDIMGVGCGYEKVDINTGQQIWKCVTGHSSFIYRRCVFGEMGYYDSVRKGGDTEYFHRATKKMGKEKFKNLDEILETSFYTGDNLTKDCSLGVFPKDRMIYLNTFKLDHDQNKLYRWYLNKPIIASIATMQGKEESCKEAIESLLPQVDKIIICCNPGSKFEYDHPKVEINRPDEDFTDNGKFLPDAYLQDCYRLTCDDDIIYPFDYASRMINNAIFYNSVVTCHGRLFEKKVIKSYYRDIYKGTNCLQDYNTDIRLHVPGTGVMAYELSTIKFDHRNFKHKKMADVYVGKLCNERFIKVMGIAHNKGWLVDSKKYDHSHGIFQEQVRDDSIQTEIINSIEWQYYLNVIKSKVNGSETVLVRKYYGDRKGLYADMKRSTAEIMRKQNILVILEPIEVKAQFNMDFVVDDKQYYRGENIFLPLAKAWELHHYFEAITILSDINEIEYHG